MKGVFCALIAIAACAMAYSYSDIFDHVCSVSGSGTATIDPLGTFSCRMIRVKDTARYDFLDESLKIIGSIVVRPDTGDTFYSLPILPRVCETHGPTLRLSRYEYEGKTEEGYDHYLYNDYDYDKIAHMYLKGNNIVKETFRIPETSISIRITYNSVNNNFEHNQVDDAFNLYNNNCSWGADRNATEARSLKECGNIVLPDYMCSVSGSGNGTYTVGDKEVSVNVKMIRVKNTVRYDLTVENAAPYGSIVMRPDIRDGYNYNALTETCSTIPDYYGLPDTYQDTIDGLDIFTPSYYLSADSAALLFNHNTHELVRELVVLSSSSSLLISYSSVDHNYVHDSNDDAFALKYDSCPDDARTKPSRALTSLQCTPMKVINSTLPGCAFNFALVYANPYYAYLDFEYNISIMMKDGWPYLAYMTFNMYGNASLTIRCDITDEKGRCLYIMNSSDYYDGYSYDYCVDDRYDDIEDLDELFPFFGFEYRGEPVAVTCPDKSSGCKKYCRNDDDDDDRHDRCRVFDKDGRLVLTDDDDFEVRYSDMVPSVDLFTGVKCNGAALEAPEPPCLDSASFIVPSVLCVVAVALLLSLF